MLAGYPAAPHEIPHTRNLGDETGFLIYARYQFLLLLDILVFILDGSALFVARMWSNVEKISLNNYCQWTKMP